jgi:hypothetical protein
MSRQVTEGLHTSVEKKLEAKRDLSVDEKVFTWLRANLPEETVPEDASLSALLHDGTLLCK